MKNVKPVVLVILDGFGFKKDPYDNAIAQAAIPNMHRLIATYPHTLLRASGSAVGLPEGMIGNSEVGHLTIGAGRIIKQPLTIINDAIADGSFFNNATLMSQLKNLAASGKTLHIMGLLSDAGVHSSIHHLIAFCTAAHTAGVARIIIHPFSDGRDVAPKSAAHYLAYLEKEIAQYPEITIGSLHGRFYAMDRNKNMDRTEKTYLALTTPHTTSADWRSVVNANYARGITDEFIEPTPLKDFTPIQNGDGVIFFNFRPDRARQLVTMLTETDSSLSGQKNHPSLSFCITPVTYGAHMSTTALYTLAPIEHTLKEELARMHKTMFSIAETEKYAHVTYFFNGEKEDTLPGEERVLIPSLPATTYKNLPEMSAPQITAKVLESLQHDPKDFYLINYANADMVGHSGDFNATVKAVKCLDVQIGHLYAAIKKMGGTLIITADHGKAEDMYDEQANQPRTAHTNNPVPLIVCKKGVDVSELRGLSDIKGLIMGLM